MTALTMEGFDLIYNLSGVWYHEKLVSVLKSSAFFMEGLCYYSSFNKNKFKNKVDTSFNQCLLTDINNLLSLFLDVKLSFKDYLFILKDLNIFGKCKSFSLCLLSYC